MAILFNVRHDIFFNMYMYTLHDLALVHADNIGIVLQPSIKVDVHLLPFRMTARTSRSCFHLLVGSKLQ